MATDELKVEALCREILDSVLSEVKSEYEALPNSLHNLTAKTKEKYEETASDMRLEYGRQDEREKTRSISQAQFQAQKAIMSKRDELVSELLEKGYEEALARWQSISDSSLVLPLAEEGISTLACPEVIVKINKAKEGQFPKDILQIIEKFTKSKVTIQYSQILPGVIVERADGRARFDNTIRDRFRRASHQLRAKLTMLLDEEVTRLREQE